MITHDIDFINKMLTEGQYFFTDIEQEGILLYDAGDTPLAERKPLSRAEAKAIAQQYYDQWYGVAKEFYTSALLNFEVKQLKVSVFNLQQATERTYNAIILVQTGYKPKTHNLDKLKRYSKRFSEELEGVLLLPRLVTVKLKAGIVDKPGTLRYFGITKRALIASSGIGGRYGASSERATNENYIEEY